MKTRTLAVLAIGTFAATPALALEHRTIIEHPAGPISADYTGSTTIEMKQVGSIGTPGRSGSLRCDWSVSLSVERKASGGTGHSAQRSMVRGDVLKGSSPGWCSEKSNAAERAIVAKRETLREAMIAMVAQDRATILVEADGMRARAREG